MIPGDAAGAAAFVRAQTVLAPARLCPGIMLHLASELTPLWLKTEAWLEENNIPPPYWAFAWPGSEALAAHIAANPALVRGRHVLDFAAGSGLAAIAARQAGAARVTAADIDPLAVAAIALNAAANGCGDDSKRAIERRCEDIVGRDDGWHVVLCGDIFYEKLAVARILPWLRQLARQRPVLIADPGRAYLPQEGLADLAVYEVPVSRELEDRDMRATRVCQLLPAP